MKSKNGKSKNGADWQKLNEFFAVAVELEPTAQSDFVRQVSDKSLQNELAAMLKAVQSADNLNFLGKDAFSVGAEVLVKNETFEKKRIGKYKIVREIGRGGMGAVFLAEREDFRQQVALKIIKRGMDTDEIVRRFRQERQVLATLKHPNIARLLDGGTTDDGLPFFVMEHIEGETITKYCDKQKLGIEERLALFRKVCAAVAYAHQNLIVHRDIKPSNILVDADGEPKLLDFGISKLLSPNAFDSQIQPTATGVNLMTPEYASPEQIKGENITTASDIYSLGILLYELLSGHRPFASKNKSYEEIVKLVLTEEPLRPSSAVSSQLSIVRKTDENKGETQREIQNPKSKIRNLKGDLDNIVLMSLRKEPSRRYSSVEQFSEDLHRHLSGLPVSATADSSFYRFTKFVKRHRQGAVISSLMALIILSVSGFAVWQGIVAVRERQKAEKRLTEIRNVAKSLMNETNDSLSKIPGNVTVQKGLAEKSVNLLDSLANEETDDTVLLAELAEAYTKLANIQIWSFREFDKAIENIEKSETIYQRILQKNPDDIEARRKIYAAQMRHIEALHDTNRREEMFRIGTEAVGNLQEIVRLEPENSSNYADLAAMYGWFGDKNMLFGRKNEAVENYRKGVEIIEQAIEKQSLKNNSVEAKVVFGRIYFIKGWLTNGAGESEKAIQTFQKSSEIARQVFAENAEVGGNFLRVINSFEAIAVIYEKQNDFQSALDAYLTAVNLVNEGLKKPEIPEYSNLLHFKCFYTVFAGKMANKLGKKNEARQYFTDGEAVCWENIKQDENDAENIFESQPYFFEIADFYVASNENEKAVNQLFELSKKLQNVLDKNRTDLTAAFSLAETFEKIGDIDGGKSHEFYEKSVKLWRDYSVENLLLPEENEKMKRVTAKLEKLK